MDARRRQSYHPEERPRRRHEEDILRGPPLGSRRDIPRAIIEPGPPARQPDRLSHDHHHPRHAHSRSHSNPTNEFSPRNPQIGDIVFVEEPGRRITSTSGTRGSLYNGEIRAIQVRRYLVVDINVSHFVGVPVTTYGGRGVNQPGINLLDHAIITGETDEELSRQRLPRLRKNIIQVNLPSLTSAYLVDFGSPQSIKYSNQGIRIGGRARSASMLRVIAYSPQKETEEHHRNPPRVEHDPFPARPSVGTNSGDEQRILGRRSFEPQLSPIPQAVPTLPHRQHPRASDSQNYGSPREHSSRHHHSISYHPHRHNRQ